MRDTPSGRGARVPERVVQSQVVHLLRSVGAQVWITGTTRRRGDYHGTMMTAGLPDVFAFVRGELVCIEVKARGGTLRTEQVLFRDCCLASNVRHLTGGVDQVLEYLVARGLVREVPHYRQPGAKEA